MESASAVKPQTELLESLNPATGEPVGSVETITPEQVQGIVDDVARVQPAWAEWHGSDARTGRLQRRSAIAGRGRRRHQDRGRLR